MQTEIHPVEPSPGRNDEETDRINFTTAEQTHTGWDHAANAYYAGELGKWNIDFNADYLFKRSHSDQNAINNDDATVQADSRMRSSSMPPSW